MLTFGINGTRQQLIIFILYRATTYITTATKRLIPHRLFSFFAVLRGQQQRRSSTGAPSPFSSSPLLLLLRFLAFLYFTVATGAASPSPARQEDEARSPPPPTCRPMLASSASLRHGLSSTSAAPAARNTR